MGKRRPSGPKISRKDIKRGELKRLFGFNLHSARAEKRSSRRELAEDTGLTEDHIGRIERGETNPRLCTMVQLAKIVGRELSDMLRQDDLDPAS